MYDFFEYKYVGKKSKKKPEKSRKKIEKKIENPGFFCRDWSQNTTVAYPSQNRPGTPRYTTRNPGFWMRGSTRADRGLPAQVGGPKTGRGTPDIRFLKKSY
jgi:hypothetical protein